MTPKKIAELIINAYVEHGNITISENITQKQHAEQCAKFAKDAGAPTEIIIAALLHDIGQLPIANHHSENIDELGEIFHEQIGANLLHRLGFPEIVVILVREHVNAKRYMMTVNKSYRKKVSFASKETLKFQGGYMLSHELKKFKQIKHFDKIIKLRTWDDKAKIMNYKTPSIHTYKQDIINVLINFKCNAL